MKIKFHLRIYTAKFITSWCFKFCKRLFKLFDHIFFVRGIKMCALFIYPTVFCIRINSVKQKNVQHFFVCLNWSVFFFKQRFWHFIKNKVFGIRHFEISIQLYYLRFCIDSVLKSVIFSFVSAFYWKSVSLY